MKIGIVLPVCNEAKEIRDVLNNLRSQYLPIFAVDDGSSDSTPLILRELARQNPKIKIYTHKINLGKGAALKTGCEAAFADGMDAVILMDSDGQHISKDLNKFIVKLKTKRYDMVLGSRNLRQGVPLVRFLGNKFATILVLVLFGDYVSDMLCGFRAITKNSYEKLKLGSAGYGIETEMVVKMSKYKLKSCEVPIKTIYHDKHKGVTIIDALGILVDVFRWRIIL